ncbi:MBL fold metallo-hydrolase [Agrococcus sp. SGAir0287]|uniref:MBL fold metallo-hydrolase n=1 Tax=Agrococcus sp. SGAir0287 TaxID=2070347 RepID=UPI0010CD5D23|nr:MBL fold metallo-hydrolase [Agrococcus sp. SGAir0287]QCR18797.1 MBL fold metallo-hydrolase [Agrococcus sp. SGAir0287]
MEITKHVHACLVLRKGDEALVVDPGMLTPDFDVDGLVGIVVTHEHADHWTPEHLRRLQDASGGVPIVAPAGVAAAASDFDVDVVGPGDERTLGSFALRFFGGRHAEIHSSIPLVDNVGVMVDDALYYPGDSFAVPDRPVELLATPCGAPWLKIGEAMDFVLDVAPRRTFATHEQPISSFGRQMADDRIRWAVEQGGGEHHVVEPGTVLTV